MSEPEPKSRARTRFLLARPRGRTGSMDDIYPADDSKSPVARRFFKITRNRDPKSDRESSEVRPYNDDSGDSVLSGDDSRLSMPSAFKGMSNMFRIKRKSRRPPRKQNQQAVIKSADSYEEENTGYGASADLPKETSFRRPPQLINDPTHMPYTPGMFNNNSSNNVGSGSFNNFDTAAFGYEEHGNDKDKDFEYEQAPQTSLAPEPDNNGLYREGNYRAGGQRARYSVYHGTVKKKFRVRPYRCFPDGRTMTEEEIYADSLKPSQDVVHLSSYLQVTNKAMKKMQVPREVEQLFGSPKDDGRIGALRVEILGCVSLARTKPDIAVYLVCGDAAFSTDVLTGYRSPMWPCASRRACVFPLHHAFVQLYIGVFDVRVRTNKENDNFCGRVALDIAALRADTEYDVTFPLRASAFAYDRRKRGVIRVRFSVHWFSERAAVLSYFKVAKGISKSSPFYEGYPTIPCADPKTFRNVAVTVYGQDMPGKYTRNAFKATIRELNLYQVNVTLLFKWLALDAMLYERIHISLYLLFGNLYCIWTGTIRMLPPICVGYLLLQFLENYNHFVEGTKFNLGYQPHTIQEVVRALFCKPDPKGAWFKPHLIRKKTKRKKGEEVKDEVNEVEIEPLDHREFPFSERDAYPKLSVEDSLAPGSKNEKKGTTRLHGRLSVYYTATPPTHTEGASHGDDDDDDDDDEDSAERDDETIVAGGDTMFGFDSDEEDEQEGLPEAYQEGGLIQASSEKRRIKLGPPQDIDIKGRKIPPQLQLQKVEKQMHKASLKVSVEQVHVPAFNETESAAELTALASALASGNEQAMQDALKKKKAVYDEFDRLLGLQNRSANPVVRIMSSFLGPLQRMLRVFIFIFRIMFHVSTWRDPFLSFWVLVFLLVVCLVLIIFPWRSFLLLLTIASLGPQNIFVRKYLEAKVAEKAEEQDDEDGDGKPDRASSQVGNVGTATDRTAEKSYQSGVSRSWPFSAPFSAPFASIPGTGKDKATGSASLSEARSLERVEPDRPPFRPDHHVAATSGRKSRSVVIPYSRLKKDRFFDWPPDPTVSKATPVPFREFCEMPPPKSPQLPPTRMDADRSYDASADMKSVHSKDQNMPKEMPRGLRRRKPAPPASRTVPRDLYL